MAEEPYDTCIDFGFDDEANSVTSLEDAQSLPAFLLEILAALRSRPPSPQAEEPTNTSTFPSIPAPLSASPSQSTPTFYHPSATLSSPLGSASGEVYPATCVRPSDTIYTYGAVPFPPAPTSHQYVQPVAPRPSRAKRLREYSEDPSDPNQSLPQKRQRVAPFRTSATHIGHPSSSMCEPPPVAEVMDGAISREPFIQSPGTWGILPPSENNSIAGPSTINIENMLCPRMSQKRTWDDGKSDGSATSNKRHKREALASAPEVLNAPVAPYYGPSSEDNPHATSAAPISRFAGFPELSPGFYRELCEIAFEIAQELKQAPGMDEASTYQNAPGSSAAPCSASEDNNKRPSATTTSKRLRTRAPPGLEPPTKRQRTSNPPNAGVLFLVTDPQTETAQKPFGCPFAGDPTACLQRFMRKTDINRHIRSKHLGVSVFCKNPAHAEPVRVVREDGVFRHLATNICIGAAARAELVAECAREIGSAQKRTGTHHWTAKVHKAASRKFARIQMPCYSRDGRFREALAHLPGWTPRRLEEWFSSYGEVQHCECERCKNIPDAELLGKVKIQAQDEPQGTNLRPSPSVGPTTAGPSSAGARAVAPAPSPTGYPDVTAISDNGEWDDKLPPEEEEGVDEDILPVSPPVADAVVVAQDDAITIASEDPPEEIVSPELQAVFDILLRLSSEDLKSVLRSPYGSQSEVNPTPDGETEA